MVFHTPGQRAWFAWHCLPRTARGTPPTLRSLERSHGLSNGSLHKLMWDRGKRSPNYDRIKTMADALGVSAEWLLHGDGDGPTAAWPVPPRPESPGSGGRGLSDDDKRAFDRSTERLQRLSGESRTVAGKKRHAS